MAGSETGTDTKRTDGTTTLLLMAALMMAMCVGMWLAVSLAALVGGPIAWGAAALVIAGLAVAHLKFMNHGGH